MRQARLLGAFLSDSLTFHFGTGTPGSESLGSHVSSGLESMRGKEQSMFEIRPSASPLLCSAWNLTQIPHVASHRKTHSVSCISLAHCRSRLLSNPGKLVRSTPSLTSACHFLTSRQRLSRLNTAPKQAAGSGRAHERVVPRRPLQAKHVFII